ncbi:hypothetical protein P153DRAFT_339703 [Dothidotthia symphoricarpi CBS 119687]|uniref:F-box domain-containing protein n=1 Tax=Dothidotthia symphoricarpi CBS 119687 TaxID=1392245 RepID=A0A6A6ADZ4_9PLEO|nr:uncharacterized protein P153DRAFT_339703 [Dothidotthia symphoricarpi CBS 119687]KAF2130132.1 hypothetical protein P153DRAFT_339703 [Dothidotthia symphoricarpi CBS 119687]
MAPATVDQQPFRFLDLPAELRCWVYKSIEISTTSHVLVRTQALLDKRDWPAPPKAQVDESRVTLIRPRIPLEILMTCHLVNEEARPVLNRKMQHCNTQPVQYLVDYSAAWALVGASALRSCLGETDEDISLCKNKAVRNFLRICALNLSQTRRTQNGSQDVRAIEMTITHKSEVVYGREVLETILWLCQLKYSFPTRLVVIYKSPFPRYRVFGDTEIRDSPEFEDLLMDRIPSESENGDQANSGSGVFVRPLEEEVFNKHVENLESY